MALSATATQIPSLSSRFVEMLSGNPQLADKLSQAASSIGGALMAAGVAMPGNGPTADLAMLGVLSYDSKLPNKAPAPAVEENRTGGGRMRAGVPA